MNLSTSARAAVVFALLASVASAAQDSKKPATPEQRLERAILLQDVERDLPAAIDALRAIADDASAAKKTRATAVGRLVKALRASGREAEAKSALDAAVAAGVIEAKDAAAATNDDASGARMRD